VAKAAKKKLGLGKPSGPQVYSKIHAPALERLGLNKRELEALDLNFGALVVTGFCLG